MAVANILVVDDDRAQLILFGFMLRRLPYAIIMAANAEEALNALYKAPPVLLVLDVMMPQVDGVTLLRALREDEGLADLKVILLTVMGGFLNQADAALADKVLAKPIRGLELEREIRVMLSS